MMKLVKYLVLQRPFDGDPERIRQELINEARLCGFNNAADQDELYWSFSYGTCSPHVAVRSALPPDVPV